MGTLSKSISAIDTIYVEDICVAVICNYAAKEYNENSKLSEGVSK